MKHLKSNVIDYKEVMFKWLNNDDKLDQGEKLSEWYMNEISQNDNSEETI